MNPQNSSDKKKSSLGCDYFTYPKDAFTSYIEDQVVRSNYF